MSIARTATAAAVGLIGTLAATHATAQAANTDGEIALLKQQLRLMEQKLDRLQKQTAATATAAAQANAKIDAKPPAGADRRGSVANANAAYPVKGPIVASGVGVTMPNNRPTICTADEQNCFSITGRLHLDGGGYDYRPNTAATSPQRLDDGINARRARIGV